MNDLSPIDLPDDNAPSNIQAEQGLLGAILVSHENSAYHGLADTLTAEHFYDPVHAEIFRAIETTIARGVVATPVTLQGMFDGRDTRINDLTIPQYLGTLAAAAASTSNAKSYAQVLYETFVLRGMGALADRIKTSTRNPPVDATAAQLLDEAEAEFAALRPRGRNERGGFIALKKGMAAGIEQANNAYSSGTGLAGLSTGLRSLDVKTGGLAPSDLIILGGRPSMGKTVLATTIAAHVARQGEGVAFFSLEMSASQLGQRVLAGDTGISASAQRRGDFGGDEGMRRLVDAMGRYDDVPLFVDDTGGVTMPQLAVKARRLARSRRLSLVVVDYLQLMGGSQYRNTNRVQELTEITTGLKALAKELNVPVIALSQLNRELEKRDDKRPMLSDLRESGSIEQDADVVMFCYRDEYYLERKRPSPEAAQTEIDDWERKMMMAAGKAEVIIAKQRHAQCATVELGFDGARSLFTDRG